MPSKEEVTSAAAIRGEGGSKKSPGRCLVSLSALGTFHPQRKHPGKEFCTTNRNFLSGDGSPFPGPRWKENDLGDELEHPASSVNLP